MKTLFVAAILAMFMATTGSALAGWNWPPRPDPEPDPEFSVTFPEYVKCLPEPMDLSHPARTVTLETESGEMVRYIIDNPFARDTGVTNLSQYFPKQFSTTVVAAIEADCEADQGIKCTYVSSEIVAPGLKTWSQVNDFPDRTPLIQ